MTDQWIPVVGDRVHRPEAPVYNDLLAVWKKAKGIGVITRVLNDAIVVVRYDGALKDINVAAHRLRPLPGMWVTEEDI